LLEAEVVVVGAQAAQELGEQLKKVEPSLKIYALASSEFTTARLLSLLDSSLLKAKVMLILPGSQELREDLFDVTSLTALSANMHLWRKSWFAVLAHYVPFAARLFMSSYEVKPSLGHKVMRGLRDLTPAQKIIFQEHYSELFYSLWKHILHRNPKTQIIFLSTPFSLSAGQSCELGLNLRPKNHWSDLKKLMNQGDWKDALVVATSLEKAAPFNYSTYESLAVIHRQLGDWDASFHYAKMAKMLDCHALTYVPKRNDLMEQMAQEEGEAFFDLAKFSYKSCQLNERCSQELLPHNLAPLLRNMIKKLYSL
jgi:hypothetical protein